MFRGRIAPADRERLRGWRSVRRLEHGPPRARLAPESRARVDSLLRLIEYLDFEVELFAKLVTNRLRTDVVLATLTAAAAEV